MSTSNTTSNLTALGTPTIISHPRRGPDRASRDAATSAHPGLSKTRPRSNHEPIETERLLIIEDDDRIARLLARALNAEGYAVEHAATGPTGLAAALGGNFHLVILDLMLPGLDGTTVLRRLMERIPGQQVLVLSAVPEVAARVECFERGAADFLGKPFALSEFLARVRARIKPPEDVLTVGPVRLDLRLHRVRAAGRDAALSYREFLLLRHLMQRAGQSCPRAELLEDVWGLAFDPGSNVVDVCVRRLRAKLDHPDRIVTVRNVGYRIDPR